jgi:flagellar M-ring protein FliF
MASAERGWVVAAAFLLAALMGGLAWYAMRPDWRTLYVDLGPDDARQMGQIPAQAQIPFEPTADGAGIRVPAAQLDKARLATAAKGGVKSGRLGFEIFDKPNWVGSEFDEQVNYQRALEGELEHTVGTLSDIASARVHQVLPHDSLFREEERPAKASVVLKLRHRTLAAEGWYPPIEVLDSISGLMPAVAGKEHREQAALVRKLMAIYARSEDLVRIGAYKAGADPDLDRALRAREAMRGFLTQEAHEQVRFADCLSRLAALAAEV